VYCANYYVSNNGNDLNDGTSIDFPWETIDKVNSFIFQPGDSVFFKAGHTWRGQLKAKSGNLGNIVYYGSYGEGTKPLILGSIDISDESFWQMSQPNIWTTPTFNINENEIISNNSFDTNLSGWIFHTQDDANATGIRYTDEYFSAPACFLVSCGSSGTYPWEIQFANQNLTIQQGKTYVLSFYAKASQDFFLNSVMLMQSDFPYQIYFDGNPETVGLNNDWNYFQIFFTSNIDADDAMINFLLGGIIPENTEVFFDDISFKEIILNTQIQTDIGNLIFNNANSFGVKKWNLTELENQADYWYDNQNLQLYLYSETNPSIYYENIEAAQTKNIIDYEGVEHAVFENIEIKYGSAHGFGGGNTNNISIKNCDISYIGGGAIFISGYGYIRYGNGIEFWQNAQNNLVEKCKIFQIYDAAITNQNAGNIAIQTNLIFRNNMISNSEWSFEYWNRPSESVTSNIYFLNNTCISAGDTWAKNQRDFDPSIRGAHLTFFQNEAQTSDFYIMNNIFYESESTILYCLRAEDLILFNFGHNCWYQTKTDTLVKIYYDENNPPYVDIVYTTNQFSDYQTNYYTESNSFFENPLFVNENFNNFNLFYNSPCLDAGYNGPVELPVGETDFAGNDRIMPGYGMPPPFIDIGCYEYDWNSANLIENPENFLKIFPNPSNDFINLESNSIIQSISVSDLYGKELINLASNNYFNIIDIASFASGTYVLKIKTNDKIVIRKLTKI